jgi:hypothetical protein
MGANTFANFGKGTDMKAVFEQLASQSRYESGHSYSGEIGMKYGVELRSPKLFTAKEAREFANSDVEKNDKHDDNCFAVKVADENGEHVGFLFYGWASS